MAHKHKISKADNILWHQHSKITNNSNYNWHIVSIDPPKKLSGINNPKKFHVASWKNFEIVEWESNSTDSHIFEFWIVMTM